jgi:hypothetical protein
MLMKTKVLAAIAAVFAFGVLGACATTGTETAATGAAARHEHMRDAKQGPASSYSGAPAAKPLHDHRAFNK